MLCYVHFVPADLDFSPAPIELLISPGSEVLDLVLHIQVIDDDIAEREEVFWVHLNCSTSDPLDKDELVIVQQSLLVRIMPDGRDGKHEFSLIRVQYNSTEIIMATMDNLSYYLFTFLAYLQEGDPTKWGVTPIHTILKISLSYLILCVVYTVLV